ncbi:MAG: glycosyltransferase family 39 protein [Anaerolineae bacterium]|nr:glycosyltransferase family 39 protein [Anaerolineae bacterium]
MNTPSIHLRHWLSRHFTVSRRVFGAALLLAGGGAGAAILAIDVLNVGREGGIGPAQGAALALMLTLALIGATLLPRPDAPLAGIPADAGGPAAAEPPPAGIVRLHRAGLLAAGAVLLFALVVYTVYAVNLMQFPFDYDQGEGFELFDTILHSRGELPYRDTEVFPFYASNYSPLYHIIAAPFVWFFGPAYWYGRLLSFLSTLVTAGLIAYAIHREEKHRPVALLAGLAFLASNTVYHIGPLFRQHISMVMFETLAVVLLARAFPRQQPWLIAAGFAALIAAGYTKQLAAISAIAVLAWALLVNPRRALLWGTGFALCGGAIFGALNVASGGEWWRQAIAANVGGINPLQVFGLFDLWFKLHGFLLVPAGLLVAYELYLGRLSLYSVWLVGAALLGGTASGTWGGGDSYFATSIAALCLAGGIFAARTLRGTWALPPALTARFSTTVRRPATAAAWLIVPLLFLGYGLATFKMPTHGPVFETLAQLFNIQPNIHGRFYDSASFNVGGYARIGYLTTPADTAAGYQIVDLIRGTDGPVMSEDAGFSLVAGREVITNPTQLLNLWRAGLFQGDALLAMLEAREFGLIILRAQFYPVPVLQAIDRHYEVYTVIRMNEFDYRLLKPRQD